MFTHHICIFRSINVDFLKELYKSIQSSQSELALVGKKNKEQKLSTTSVSSDWLLLFCQGVKSP